MTLRDDLKTADKIMSHMHMYDAPRLRGCIKVLANIIRGYAKAEKEAEGEDELSYFGRCD